MSGEYIVVEKHVLEKILKEVQEIQQEFKELSGPKPSLNGRFQPPQTNNKIKP